MRFSFYLSFLSKKLILIYYITQLMIHLFIDTNRYLALYGFPKDKLDDITKIVDLIKKQKIVLYLPEQVENEFFRNREQHLMDILDGLESLKIDYKISDLPNIPESQNNLEKITLKQNIIKQNYREINTTVEKIKDEFCKKIKNKSFEVDKIISNFFGYAKRIPYDDETIERAFRRFKLGNPPGKKGSNGDAVIWESLLKDVPDKTDLCFVGYDKDFKSKSEKTAFSPYLLSEWKSKKKASIIPFDGLGEFIKAKIPEIKNPNSIISKEDEIDKEYSIKIYYDNLKEINDIINYEKINKYLSNIDKSEFDKYPEFFKYIIYNRYKPDLSNEEKIKFKNFLNTYLYSKNKNIEKMYYKKHIKKRKKKGKK
jgi:hypothetical protein